MAPERQYELLYRMTVGDHKRALKLYRRANWIWLGIAFSAFVSGYQYWIEPDLASGAIDRQLSPLGANVWHVGFIIAALFLIRGIWWAQVRAEITGHVFLASSLLTNTVAVYQLAGITPGMMIAFLFAVSSVERARFLWEITPSKKAVERASRAP